MAKNIQLNYLLNMVVHEDILPYLYIKSLAIILENTYEGDIGNVLKINITKKNPKDRDALVELN